MWVPLKFGKKWREKSQRAAAGSLETQVPLTDDEVRAVWMCASWLIGYPGAEVHERLDVIAEVAAGLPEGVATDLLAVVERLRSGDPVEICAEYVETFDTRRRGCLYLTYFANGDTRKRGMALLDIKNAYREAALEVSEDELPDHLAYVLEFGAAHDVHRGASILLANRAGIELLRLHLIDIDSPWAGVLRAVCATLPALDGDDIHAVQRLAAEGPEEELVGLAGYGDGSADMPPADMTPYATAAASSGAPEPYSSAPEAPGQGSCGPVSGGFSAAPGSGAQPAFIPLSDVKGLQP